ncbi:S-adenosylmethionine-dependent methyltransferase, partial [Coemansia thaxteri]
MGIPTPDTRHLRKAEYATVYEPAEDTHLLLDALENDRTELHELRPTICVEIGSGSGCVSAFLGQVLSPYGALVL